jgi:tetratricopeptide (TPR) repeat protein
MSAPTYSAIVGLAALLWSASALQAQDLTAQVTLQTGRVETMALAGSGGGQLKFRPASQQSGSISISPATALQIQVNFPESVAVGFGAMEKGDWAAAARLLGPSANAAAPYLAIANNNIAPVVMTYGDALRYSRQFDAAIGLFEKLQSAPSPSVARLGSAWKAYLLINKGDIPGARALVETLGDPQREDEIFGLVRLARAMIFLHTEQHRAAVDQIAQVIAFSGLESSIYPEALYVDGLCYEAIAAAERRKAEQERDEAVKRALFTARVRVGREMWTAAQQQGLPPPTEKEILAKIDADAISARIPAVPPLEEAEKYQVSQQIYTHLARTFPRTPWAAEALKRLKNPPASTSSKKPSPVTPS